MIGTGHSIERKVIAAMLAVAVAGIALVSAVLLASGWRNVTRDRLVRAQVLVDLIASNIAPAIVFNDEKVAEQILTGAAADQTALLAAVYTEDGKMFAHYPAAKATTLYPAPLSRRFEFTGQSLDGFADVMMNGRRVGSVFVRMDLAPMRRRFQMHLWTALACMVVATLVAFALARYLQRRIVQPILSLYQTARAVTERRDFSLRAEKRSADEIGNLADAFNAMLSDIEASHAQIQGHASELEKEVHVRTAELRELVAELETFSYSVSHDLRAPLRAIVGFSEAALEPQTTPAERNEYLHRSLRAARRMDRLINDLLQYARVSKSQFVLVPVDLDAFVADIRVQHFATNGSNAGINVRAPLGWVVGDEAALAQVFSNLIGNALKFVPADRRPLVEIWTEQVGTAKRVHVRDNGIGIPAEQRDRLFRIFERLSNAERFEGTGIGLSIVKKAVEKMNGTLGLESEVGRGSTFWFELSPATASTDQRPQPTAASSRGSKL